MLEGRRRRRSGGPAPSIAREIHYHDNGFSDWLTCLLCLPGWLAD